VVSAKLLLDRSYKPKQMGIVRSAYMNVANKMKLESGLQSLFEVEDGAHRLQKLQNELSFSAFVKTDQFFHLYR